MLAYFIFSLKLKKVCSTVGAYYLSAVYLIGLLISVSGWGYSSTKCNAAWAKHFLVGGVISMTQFTSSWGACSAIGQHEQRDLFIAHNIENLKIDSARGHGEYVDAVAELSGCDTESSKKIFCAKLQKNLESVFYDGQLDSSSKEITERIDNIISSTPELKKGCKVKG